MSNFSVTKVQDDDDDGFISVVKIQRSKPKPQPQPQIQSYGEYFNCKMCKIDYCLDSNYVDYLKKSIKNYEKRTICQKCKNLKKVSKGETPIPLRPDLEWRASIIKQKMVMSNVDDDIEAWPALPSKPKEIEQKKEEKKHVHVILTVEPGKSWADYEEEC